MTSASRIGESDELRFLRQYESVTLWKPQVVADNVLTGIFLADATYRGALAALLLQEAVESARRLAAVWHALADRSVSPVRRLRDPLPGSEAFAAMAADLEPVEQPEEVLVRLGVDDSALDSARELLAFGGLPWFAEAIRCAELGPPDVEVEAGVPAVLRWHGHGRDGSEQVIVMQLEDPQVIALGDATGDFVTWAREFLGAYIDGRAGTGPAQA